MLSMRLTQYFHKEQRCLITRHTRKWPKWLSTSQRLHETMTFSKQTWFIIRQINNCIFTRLFSTFWPFRLAAELQHLVIHMEFPATYKRIARLQREFHTHEFYSYHNLWGLPRNLRTLIWEVSYWDQRPEALRFGVKKSCIRFKNF